MYRMFYRKTMVLQVLSCSLAASLRCSLSANNNRPTVSLESSTELLVSYEHVFENCNKSDVEEVKIVTAEGEQKIVQQSFDQHTATIATSPCVKHSGIQVELIFTEDYKSQTLESELRSEETTYNNEDPDINKYPYQGFLQREVLSELCQDQDGTIKTPDVPRILDKCKVYTVHELTGEHSGTITTTFMDPENTSQLKTKKVDVPRFKNCPSSAPTTPSAPATPSTPVAQCTNTSLMYVSVSVAVVLLLVLVSSWFAMKKGKIVWKKKDTGTDMYMKCSSDEQPNP